ncbi:MAG: ETC complex I subunit [Alphaproteobacteria bacterium]|nr:ETC complex I subunit [Alphaproteobacteria bacterium SS10]
MLPTDAISAVRIYQPAKTTMQSGRAKLKQWLLEYEVETARRPEPLMGWTMSGDTLNQVRLKFGTSEEAVAFAEAKGWTYTLEAPRQRRVTPKNYGDNFRTDRPAR